MAIFNTNNGQIFAGTTDRFPSSASIGPAESIEAWIYIDATAEQLLDTFTLMLPDGIRFPNLTLDG